MAFQMVSSLAAREEDDKVNILICRIGNKADNIMQSFQWSAADARKQATVREWFNSHFINVNF